MIIRQETNRRVALESDYRKSILNVVGGGNTNCIVRDNHILIFVT